MFGLLKVSNCAGSALLFSLCVCTPAAYGATRKKVYASETMIWSTEEGNNGVFGEVELRELSSEVYVREGGWVYGRFYAENLNEDYEKLFNVKLAFALRTEESVSVEVCRRDDKTERFKEEPKDLTKFILECSEWRPFLYKGRFKGRDLEKFEEACRAFPEQPIKDKGHVYSVKNVINIDITKEEESAPEQSWVRRHPKFCIGVVGVGVLVIVGVALGSSEGRRHLLEAAAGVLMR